MEKPIVRLGTSAAIRDVEDEIELAVQTDARVLLTGESGVGKEFIARLIHDRGPRTAAPFVHVRCAGTVPAVLEAELFGSPDRGAARERRSSELERAGGGSVFLDEVGEMTERLQLRLLQFLETGNVWSPHVTTPRRPGARVIASTSRTLMRGGLAGPFRHDLYYRLNVVHIAVPPLRHRREDIVVLMSDFLRAFAAAAGVRSPELTSDAWQRLKDYAWPGNVRELRQVAKRLIRHHGGGRVGAGELPGEIFLQAGHPSSEGQTVCADVRPLARSLTDVDHARVH
jgi:DNA-binding NtrC family response regulator